MHRRNCQVDQSKGSKIAYPAADARHMGQGAAHHFHGQLERAAGSAHEDCAMYSCCSILPSRIDTRGEMGHHARNEVVNRPRR